MILSGERGRIAGAVNCQGITDGQVRRLEPVDMQGDGLVPRHLSHHPLGKEGHHASRRGRCGLPLVPRHLLILGVQRPPALPLEHALPQEPDDGAPHSRGNPLRLFAPDRGDGGGMLAPAQAWLPRCGLRAIGLDNGGIRTARRADGRGQDTPSRLVLRWHARLRLHPQTIPSRAPSLSSFPRSCWPSPTRRTLTISSRSVCLEV